MKKSDKNIIDAIAITFLILCFALYYKKVFDGGVKTSVAVQEWGAFFFITGIAVLIRRSKDIYEKKIGPICLSVLLLLLGINLLLFDYLNIVVNYDDWLKRGLHIKY